MDTDHLLVTFAAAPPQAPLTKDIVLEDFGQNMVYRGRQAVAPVLRAYFGDGFPDGRMSIHASLANDQNMAMAFTFYGRQDGIFLGIPATGRKVAVPMFLFCQVARHRIRHIAWYYNPGTILRQLGLSPRHEGLSIS